MSVTTTARRAGAVLVVVAVGVILSAQGASAADGMASAVAFGIGDSHGIDSDTFTMSVNGGNRLNPGDNDLWIWSLIMTFAWEAYKAIVVGAIVILDWVMKMEWVSWFLTPLTNIGNVVDEVIDLVGVAPLMLTILGVVVAFWWFRGRTGSGFSELLIGCTIAALSAVYLANPTAMVAGDHGLIVSSRDAGMDMATTLVTDGRTTAGSDSSVYLSGLTSSLVDSMVRTPHQVLNYGTVLDGTACESVYNEAVGEDDARTAIGACSEPAKLYTDAPNGRTAWATIEAIGTGFVFSLFVFGMVAMVLLSVIAAGWAAVKIIATAPLAVVPGAPRAALFKALGSAATCAIAIAGLAVFVVAWMELVSAMFAGGSGLGWSIVSKVVNIVLLFGPIAFFLLRSRISKAMARAAARLSRLGPKASTPSQPVVIPRLQQGAKQVVKHVVRKQIMTDALSSKPKTPKPSTQPHATPPPPPAPGSSAPAAVTAPPATGPTPPPGPTPPSDPMPSGPAPAPAPAAPGQIAQGEGRDTASADKLKRRLKSAGTAAIHLTAFATTGGTSAVASAASAAVRAHQIVQTTKAARDLVNPTRTSQNVALRAKLEAVQPRRMEEVVVPRVTEVSSPARKVTEVSPDRRPVAAPKPAPASPVAPLGSTTSPRKPVARRLTNG